MRHSSHGGLSSLLRFFGDILPRLRGFFEPASPEVPPFAAEAWQTGPKLASCGPERACLCEILAGSVKSFQINCDFLDYFLFPQRQGCFFGFEEQ